MTPIHGGKCAAELDKGEDDRQNSFATLLSTRPVAFGAMSNRKASGFNNCRCSSVLSVDNRIALSSNVFLAHGYFK